MHFKIALGWLFVISLKKGNSPVRFSVTMRVHLSFGGYVYMPAFIFIPSSIVRTAKALTRLRIWAASSEPSLFVNVNALSTKVTQWLSGRMLDSRPKGLRVRASPATLGCVLESDTLILA